jgi:hypothetical protein
MTYLTGKEADASKTGKIGMELVESNIGINEIDK